MICTYFNLLTANGDTEANKRHPSCLADFCLKTHFTLLVNDLFVRETVKIFAY